MYFNWRDGTVGHLFQGRYKAILCDRDAYLFSLVKYLHCNPVRAGMVQQPGEYRWSSHRTYLGLNEEGFVDKGIVLRMFSKNLERGCRLYQEYMQEEEKAAKEGFYQTVDQRVLGDDAFVESVRARVDKAIAPGRRKHGVTLGAIGRGIEEIFGIRLGALRGKGKDTLVMEGRIVFSVAASEYGYRGKEMAAFLEKDPASVTGYLRRSRDLQSKKDQLLCFLKAGRKNLNN
jgi:putative transposase